MFPQNEGMMKRLFDKNWETHKKDDFQKNLDYILDEEANGDYDLPLSFGYTKCGKPRELLLPSCYTEKLDKPSEDSREITPLEDLWEELKSVPSMTLKKGFSKVYLPHTIGKAQFKEVGAYLLDEELLTLRIVYSLSDSQPNPDKLPSRTIKSVRKKVFKPKPKFQTRPEKKPEDGNKENLDFLKSYPHSVRYVPSKGPRRRKRIIKWKYQNWQKEFVKAWNFIDHARMHLGVKPYQCHLWSSAFTQKGNLKKHAKVHEIKP